MPIVFTSMQLLVFLLAYPFLWVISILPYRLFYMLSDFLFFLIYHLAGYRRKVVTENLQLVFPEKSDIEIKQIRRQFYAHFCDVMLETVKTMNLSSEDMISRFRCVNIELLQGLEKERNVLLLCSHYANWEWIISINNYLKSQGYAVYQDIGNPYFDKLIKRIRSKWNTIPINQKETVKTVMRNDQNNKKGVYGMVSDQSPMAKKAQYWTPFLGVTVPIFNGPENIARKLDMAVVFVKVDKLKRGYYQAELIPITTTGKNTEEHQITNKFLQLTEEQIQQRPELYLWTHRRWKHRDKVPEGIN
ncbi:lysophospholipid acyltransferase family protein [Muriicola sp. Z0-33]|uniref:lysophospholipid acyltransferase family protein n=1 Tax=Muriicola sp. Z0-33 TaxID=2816957 RepID=UPI002238CE78|nr:lipid A biosynthesis acyltransferase [Muriicola sp. Z0-33]